MNKCAAKRVYVTNLSIGIDFNVYHTDFRKSFGLKYNIERVTIIVFHHKSNKFSMKFLNDWCYITMCPAKRVYVTNS